MNRQGIDLTRITVPKLLYACNKAAINYSGTVYVLSSNCEEILQFNGQVVQHKKHKLTKISHQDNFFTVEEVIITYIYFTLFTLLYCNGYLFCKMIFTCI